MICTWCDREIRRGEEVALDKRRLSQGIVFCTTGCMDNAYRYTAASGIPIKAKEENLKQQGK